VGYDGDVHLCDARTGQELLVLRGFGPPNGDWGYTPRIAFSPAGSRIAAHYAVDQSLNVWDLGSGWAIEAEPEPEDLRGWLRHSRALAEEGDVARAEAAYTRARALDGADPSPWIEHAVSLLRRSDSPQARDALARVMSSLPDDPGRWIDLGRLLTRFGRTKESETALAKARYLLEQLLSRAPDDEVAAAALADVLPDASLSRGWTLLQPEVMTSAGGATLTRLPDGSVVAGGLNPIIDTYTFEAVTTLAGITALRLEALPDPSLPYDGPGRCTRNGNFNLDAIRLSAVLEREVQARCQIPLIRACADYSGRTEQEGIHGVIGALDADPTTMWSIYPQAGRAHQAVFQTAEPFGVRTGTRLRVELDFRAKFAQAALGRFRLSVTDQPALIVEPSLTRIKADGERNGLTRLGAAYVLLGEWAAAAAVLGRTVARPDASAVDGFLLALSRDRLGKRDEARSDCDRAFERLTTKPVEDATHDLAIEALITIRGLSVDKAESLLLDVSFPANPFSP
jgi:hypothetical protein